MIQLLPQDKCFNKLAKYWGQLPNHLPAVHPHQPAPLSSQLLAVSLLRTSFLRGQVSGGLGTRHSVPLRTLGNSLM